MPLRSRAASSRSETTRNGTSSRAHSVLHGRIVHLVRHGQYESEPGGSGRLTALGRAQSRAIARYFSGLSVASVRSSDLPRAVETAEILAGSLGIDRPPRHRVLRELLPTSLPQTRVARDKQREGQRRIERILERFFKHSTKVRHDIIVCHGNLIRALVVRVATGRFAGWHRFALHHASVTSFAIRPNGIVVLAMNAQEHIGRTLRSDR